jgi:hypothetical protein
MLRSLLLTDGFQIDRKWFRSGVLSNNPKRWIVPRLFISCGRTIDWSLKDRSCTIAIMCSLNTVRKCFYSRCEKSLIGSINSYIWPVACIRLAVKISSQKLDIGGLIYRYDRIPPKNLLIPRKPMHAQEYVEHCVKQLPLATSYVSIYRWCQKWRQEQSRYVPILCFGSYSVRPIPSSDNSIVMLL